MKPEVAVERVSPTLARQLLAVNQRNRSLRSPRVTQLAESMRRGEWELNGETIKIAEDGTLLDGQHRLQAVVESGVTIEALLMRNLPREAQDTVDTGRRRRLADVLAIEGFPDSHALGAAVSILFRYRNGTRIDYSHKNAPTPRQALDLLAEEPDLIESVRVARRLTKKVRGPIGVFSALHYVFSEVDPDATDEFFERLIDGNELQKGDPVLQLRDQLLKPRVERNYAQSPYYVAALMIKAFNLRRENRTVSLLSFRNTEKFPVLNPPELEGATGGG